VIGARSTTDSTPTFTFKSKGARSFVCGVDTTVLKKCAARYTTTSLSVGAHKLRVRALDAKKRMSRIATVTFTIRALPPPPVPPRPSVGRRTRCRQGVDIAARRVVRAQDRSGQARNPAEHRDGADKRHRVRQRIGLGGLR